MTLMCCVKMAKGGGSHQSRSASENSGRKRNIQAPKPPGSRSEASSDAEAGRAGAVPHLRMLHSSIDRRCMWVLPPLSEDAPLLDWSSLYVGFAVTV
jgi:hypothetical protein